MTCPYSTFEMHNNNNNNNNTNCKIQISLFINLWNNGLHDGYVMFIILQNNYKHCHINAMFGFMVAQTINDVF
jgi:hypothetical protein